VFFFFFFLNKKIGVYTLKIHTHTFFIILHSTPKHQGKQPHSE